MTTLVKSALALGNEAFRNRNFVQALEFYEKALVSAEEPLKNRILFNHRFILQHLGKSSVNSLLTKDIQAKKTKFDIGFYLANNEDVKTAGAIVQEHYWFSGEKEGRWPNPYFDPSFYSNTNADVRTAKVSPFRHYIDAGCNEGRLGCSPIKKNARQNLVSERPLLFVGHDGIQAGSEVVLLETIRWFFAHTLRKIKLLLLAPGPMVNKYADYADIYVLPEHEVDEPGVLKDFLSDNFQFVYLNTVVSGRFLQIIFKQQICLDIPFIAHIHEMERVLDVFPEELQSLKRRVSHWITASPSSTLILSQKHCIEPKDISTVPAFIQPVILGNASNNELKKAGRLTLGLAEEAFVVMGCGTVYSRKGPDLFVDTARLMRLQTNLPINFVWLGEGPDRSSIEASLTSVDTGFIGFVGHRTDANSLLASADVFFLSSREDPFPLVVLESAQHGVPTVCFAPATGITKFIGQESGIALPHINAESAANALINLMQDSVLRRKMGDSARLKLFEEYTADKQTLKLYEAVHRNTDYRPSVSVIVLFFNHEAFVNERLDSIIRQSVKDIEIIILDDFSTDGTLEKIEPYLIDRRVRLIKNTRNSGSPFKQWEKGIRQAQSNIVWIAEGDDSCTNNFISTLLPYFDDGLINIAAARTEIIDESGEIVLGSLDSYLDGAKNGKFKNSYIKDGFVEVNEQLGAACTIVNASGVLFRKSSFGAALINAQEFRMCGDWLIYLECLRDGKIAYDVGTKNFFRRHTNSQVHKIEGTPTYFMERRAITDFVLENYLLTEDILAKIFHLVDQEWQRFKYKNTLRELVDFYDKSHLKAKARRLLFCGHVGFYVHGLTFSKGGIERLAGQLANHLVENGWQVTIYCKLSDHRMSIYPLYESVRVNPIFDENTLESSTASLSRAIAHDKVDIFVPMLSEWLFEPIIEAGRRSGTKILASEHNDPWKIEELWWSKENRHACFEKVDAIHLLLDKFTTSLPIHLHDKVITIPNGINAPKSLRLDDREKLILSVGRLEKQKRFDILIEAVYRGQATIRASGYRVEIYGDGSLYGVLRRQIDDRGVQDLVYLKGNSDSIEDEYARASFFVLSSEFEGFGIVVLEALSHGMPVIAFNECNGPNEIVRNGQDGILVESEDELAHAILRLVKGVNPKMRQAAVDRANEYSLTIVFEKWKCALSNLMQQIRK